MLALVLPFGIQAHAQLHRLDSASSFAPSAGLVDFEGRWGQVNPAYTVATPTLGTATVATGSGFLGEVINNEEIPSLTANPFPGLSFKPSSLPPIPLHFSTDNYVATYKDTVNSVPPFSRGPSVLMSDYWSSGPISLRFSTPVAAVGFELANSFGWQTPYIGVYQIFVYGADGEVLGQFGNLRVDTVYKDPTTYEFVGFATDGLPLIQGISIVQSSTISSNRIANLRFGTAADVAGGLQPVPEPATYGMVGCALLLGITALRRNRRQGSS